MGEENKTEHSEMIKKYEDLLNATNRDGMNELIDFIRQSDFYTAPASTRFHSSHEGGLLEHSMNVYNCLVSKLNNNVWSSKLAEVPIESFTITALLHDLCKTYYYVTDFRNKKNEKGVWEQVPYYTVKNRIPYGHGEKSVMMIEEYIKLTGDERYAIRWHMGFSEPKEYYNEVGQVFETYPLALALHEADLEATNLFEEEG